MTKIAGPFGSFPHSYVVYSDPTYRRPFAVGRINSKGQVVERVANRSTEADAIKEAKRRAS